MRSSLTNCEECEQMNKVFLGQTAIFQKYEVARSPALWERCFFNLRYIWNRQEFSSYPLKTVIFTVGKLNTQDREK